MDAIDMINRRLYNEAFHEANSMMHNTKITTGKYYFNIAIDTSGSSEIIFKCGIYKNTYKKEMNEIHEYIAYIKKIYTFFKYIKEFTISFDDLDLTNRNNIFFIFKFKPLNAYEFINNMIINHTKYHPGFKIKNNNFDKINHENKNILSGDDNDEYVFSLDYSVENCSCESSKCGIYDFYDLVEELDDYALFNYPDTQPIFHYKDFIEARTFVKTKVLSDYRFNIKFVLGYKTDSPFLH